MVALKKILTALSVEEIIGESALDITSIEFDSRKVKNSSLFVAIKGEHTNGHQYIDNAIAGGATVIVCEALPSETRENICYVRVSDSNEALGQISTRFYDDPSTKLKLVGVTGTNGKTTIATLLYQLFKSLGYKTGLISTVENKIGDQTISAGFTTPFAPELNRLLNQMVEQGCEFVFMEVSSHAIHQRRIGGVKFSGGIFSNLSLDHLDYHKTFKEYLRVKKQFFDELPKEAFALTNLDDKNGMVMLQNTNARKYKYSLRTLTDFKAKIKEDSLAGLHLQIDGEEFYARLIGSFNAYNLLAVYGTARLLDVDKIEVLTQLSQLTSVEGRFDYIRNPKNNILGIVDYSHTPDALEKVLTTISKLKKNNEKVITVVGCGGDRDKSKRPIMAQVASRMSDQVILTSDNPRTEDPDAIIEEMENGLSNADKSKVLSITNRRQAIKTASRIAQNGSIILVAGKGHEKYQEINGVKHPFDDKEILKEALENV